MPPQPIPEHIYDAAMRVVTRDQLPDDPTTLEQWYLAEVQRTVREIALEVIRQVAENGHGRRCVD